MAENKVYEIITDRILQSLEKGVVPWRQPWASVTPMSLISKKPYRGVNVFLLGMQRYASPYWLSYKQAKDKKGYARQGEKPTPIIFWKKLLKDKKLGDTPNNRFFMLRYYNVFNVSQCDGIEAPEAKRRPDFNPIEECEKVVSGYGGVPTINHGGGRAYYSPTSDEISMPIQESFHGAEEYYSTLFHELTHSTGAEKRLGRKGITDPIRFASHDYSFEELIAECGAAFLCVHSGIAGKTLDNSAAYIASWVSKLKSETKWIIDAAGAASRATDYILGKTYEDKEEDES